MIGLQFFRDIPTELEINGPILSFSVPPTVTLEYKSSDILISPATPSGLTRVTLSDFSSFNDFDSNKIYTLTPQGDIEINVTLEGASGGGSDGGKGGKVKGKIILEFGKIYQLVIGSQGSQNGINGIGGGGDSFTGGNSGGGYTGIFEGSISQDNAILIAGGGGGAAENNYRRGFDGGGLDGVGGPGVGGGTQTRGGSGFYSTGYDGLYDYMNGSALQGGRTINNQNQINAGGAGGGGYFGGGAGRGDSNFAPGPYGGAGGSGFIHPSLVINGLFEAASNVGGGKVNFESTSKTGVSSAIFVGIATATFPNQTPSNPALNSGVISYRWYENGLGPLSDNDNIVGSSSTTLILSNIKNPDDNGREFYLSLDYIPAGETPNANNEILRSDIVTIPLPPYILINSQPTNSKVSVGSNSTFSVSASISDIVYGSLDYQWQLNGSNLQDGLGISGSNTDTLVISRSVVGINTIRVLITNSNTAPVASDDVTLEVVEARSILKFESYGTTSTATLLDRNLDQSEFSITSDILNSDDICFYSSEKDLEVELDLYGAKGSNKGSFVGGEGGYSKISFTMKKDEEYILRGIKSNSALFLYRKGSLIAVVGQGGGAGNVGNGGKGGGVNLAGQSGNGSGAGSGGNRTSIGGLFENGIYGSASSIQLSSIYSEDEKASVNDGGRTIKCSKGVYWRNQGLSSCQDIGVSKFRLSDGTEVTNSASITRGFKAGYTINRTAGAAANTNSGVGGDGATGGNGGGASQGGGGGGSGYSDGSISIINTQLGGSTGNARVNIRLSDGGFYVDNKGRILILSCTDIRDPRTLTRTTGKVLPGTNSCIDDTRWQRFLDLSRSGTENYRLTATLDNSTSKITNATDRNIHKMLNANQLILQNSLIDWYDMSDQYLQGRLALVWDETSGATVTGIDYSLLWWVKDYGWGYYGFSNNSFFTPTVYYQKSANWWILPPGVPDFS